MSNPDAKQLILAAFQGDFATVKIAIQAGVDPDSPDKNGMTALHWAATKGHNDVAKILLGNGANAVSRDNSGQTPKDKAIRYNQLQIIDIIQNFSLNLQDILFKSVSNSDIKMLERAFARGAHTSTMGKDGHTALGIAAWQGNIEIAELLLERGANVNAVDAHDWTALGVAAFSEHIEIVKLLISWGADIYKPNGQSGNVLNIAVSQGNCQIAHLIQKHRLNIESIVNDVRVDRLLEAVHTKNEMLLKAILRQGVNPNSRGLKKVSAIELASVRGHLSFVGALLVAGAYPSPKSDYQFSPLNNAISAKQSGLHPKSETKS